MEQWLRAAAASLTSAADELRQSDGHDVGV